MPVCVPTKGIRTTLKFAERAGLAFTLTDHGFSVQTAKDGYGIQWQTCFLAHHAFTLCLLPALQSAAQQAKGNNSRVRVVNVASDGAVLMGPKAINYEDPNLTRLTGKMAPW